MADIDQPLRDGGTHFSKTGDADFHSFTPWSCMTIRNPPVVFHRDRPLILR
jgi:hypothetical protein